MNFQIFHNDYAPCHRDFFIRDIVAQIQHGVASVFVTFDDSFNISKLPSHPEYENAAERSPFFHCCRDHERISEGPQLSTFKPDSQGGRKVGAWVWLCKVTISIEITLILR